MWHLDQISVGTKYDKFEELTQLTVGEYKTYSESIRYIVVLLASCLPKVYLD